MTLQKISPAEAKALLDAGAVMVDVREPSERTREHIDRSVSLPLSELARKDAPKDAKIVIYHCRSGMRTASNATALAGKSDCQAYILDGGLDAWRNAGLPVTQNTSAPIDIMRQVQITAGGLVVASVLLGAYVSPAWLLLAGGVGAGLVFSGVSGTCGMARLLSLLPWNRVAA